MTCSSPTRRPIEPRCAQLVALPARRPGARIAVMVDSVAQLAQIEAARAGAGEAARVRVCIDLDAGYRMLGGRVRVGAKRSPVHTPEQAVALARAILARDGLELVGIMAYEAQTAGLGDAPPGRPLRALAIRALQALSVRELAVRRAAAVAAVRELSPLELVNGGGTGSLHLTAREPSVTEVTAGSGLYAPLLFDSYRSFQPRPAALFALPVVRRPGPGVVTALGGGYLASGPADAARLPRPHLPRGLRLDRQEGAGEVQTPLLGSAAERLQVGDRVWFRHAKAGELCERFTHASPARGRARGRAASDLPRRGTMLSVSSEALDAPPVAIEGTLREVVETLAPLDRAPCSPGERVAAEWLHERLGSLAGVEAELEVEPSWGTFPPTATGLGLTGVLGALLTLRGHRAARRAARLRDVRRDRRRGRQRAAHPAPRRAPAAQHGQRDRPRRRPAGGRGPWS